MIPRILPSAPRTFGRHTLVLHRLSDKVATGP
jgi:hypothetical protein